MKELNQLSDELQRVLDIKIEVLEANGRYNDTNVVSECQNRQRDIDGFKMSIQKALQDPLVANHLIHRNQIIESFRVLKEEILTSIAKIY